jgi:YopX protein.|nr:MAG TPA: YopX protein [Caudoviricetes sp.]DAO98268.1 MAG TPA: YopX protein [Caudoviricetes sp.]DAT24322.1 MAG TPA: YopX protein [Caudoviricetes sp.]
MIPKYRAWDSMRKEMNYKVMVGNCDENDENWTCPIIWIEEAKDWLHFDDYKRIMLSTCLLDKNGQEIFEGDVVDYKGRKAVIKWHGSYASFIYRFIDESQTGKPKWNPLYLAYMRCEIIGNIYENPELLEV